MKPIAPNPLAAPGYVLVSAVFLRLLGLVYLAAFTSLALQVRGLAGSEGILPLAPRLEFLAAQHGWQAWFRLPTLFWLHAGDQALVGACWLGVAAAACIALGYWMRPALLAAFALYLSLYHAGDVFLNFQWDGLLLEAGFLALFLHPRSRLAIFLFRWLLFRLRFMSGLSKLVSGDPSWPGLTALNHYFEVQPLPSPLAWYAHQLPDWMLRLGTATTLGVELLVPLMMFLPRPLRLAAAGITVLWQVLIILTSNHNWFNFLTIALCLFLLDDRALRALLPRSLSERLAARVTGPTSTAAATARGALAAVLLLVSSVQFWELASGQSAGGVLGSVVDQVEAFRVSNKYHVFPTMKTERYELEITGSVDGQRWHAYRFRYKPQAPEQRPQFVIPHQPRLDWMMWFVTLHPDFMPFFDRFLRTLLENSPAVNALLAGHPLDGRAPRYLRVEVFRYRFSTPAEQARTGHWWQRESLGPFPPLPGLQRPAATTP